MYVEIMGEAQPLRFYRPDSDSIYRHTVLDMQNCGFDVSTDCPWFPDTACVQFAGSWLHFRLWSRVNGYPAAPPRNNESFENHWSRIESDAFRFHLEWKSQDYPIMEYDLATGMWIDKFMTSGREQYINDRWNMNHHLRCVDATKTFGEIWPNDSFDEEESD